jgi:hypothetical protein
MYRCAHARRGPPSPPTPTFDQENKMYDSIVIGARCAGAPTAKLLARRGHRVLLVDRATIAGLSDSRAAATEVEVA